MKILFSLFTVVLFVFTGLAQEKSDLKLSYLKSGSITTTFNKEVIEYKFKSLEDLSIQLEEIIKEIDFNNSENKKEFCKIMIELKLEIAIGVTTLLMSETIITNCEDESAIIAIEKFKAMLTAAIG